MTDKSLIRNVAIIAHVDHGKTSLVDALMKQSHLFRDNQKEMNENFILDFNELEREKGITIQAKNISIRFKEYKINIIDTPGHADFGGEVERTLTMADGVILLIDAQEGPMPQTRFVLKRALELQLKPILIINKIDKSHADPAHALDKATDLFLMLAKRDEDLEFPTLYAIGREGKVWKSIPDGNPTSWAVLPGDITPILETIVEHIPEPKGDIAEPLLMQVASMDYDSHVGRSLIGRIQNGIAKKGDPIILLQENSKGEVEKHKGRIDRLQVREGLVFTDVESAGVGEIISISGIDVSAIGGTICSPEKEVILPAIKISNPSVQITFEANTSPYAGKEGKFVTMKLLQQRLDYEKETNVGLTIKKLDEGRCSVAGRGELQLSILIETLRREGYEFQVRRPEVVLQEIDGVTSEPVEELYIDVPEEYAGEITQIVSKRKGELVSMETENGQTKFVYKILTRNLLGIRTVLLTSTKGNVIMANYLSEYVPYTKQAELFRKGVLIATETGDATGYALNMSQERGELFVQPGDKVYEGMIVGINKFQEDIEVNAVRAKHATNIRSATADAGIKLKPPVQLSIEFALAFLAKDEMLEITPLNLRLRKIHLTKTARDIQKRKERNLNDNA
ncbi:MAG: GTP-binding protein [Candidatus Dojkabacteria bacterium]|nr:MAG: GTP-binding protein [Candidatus Dojkabacteria bacterium]